MVCARQVLQIHPHAVAQHDKAGQAKQKHRVWEDETCQNADEVFDVDLLSPVVDFNVVAIQVHASAVLRVHGSRLRVPASPTACLEVASSEKRKPPTRFFCKSKLAGVTP
eukprot:3932872-Rhodomonas_salina.6